LRQRAAKHLEATQPTASQGLDKRRLAQELDIHRVELELQNEELRQTRGDLEAGLERYTQLFDFAPLGYCTMGWDGLVAQVNHAGATLLDEPRSHIVGKKFSLFVAPPDRPSFDDLMKRAAATGEAQMGEFTLMRVHEDRPTVRLRAAPMQDPNAVVLLAFEDITPEKRAEERLRRVHEELREADRRKDEFLAVLSHELRTPLSTLLIHGQLLQQHAALDPARARRSGEAIERAARAQARLVDDLLDVSKIIAGKMRMQVDRIEIASVVQAAVEAHAGEAAGKQIQLTASVDPELPALNADAGRLQQAIGNLLHNAVKFTPPGGRIRVTVDSLLQKIRIQVSDDGAGIDGSFLPVLFERFSQADRTTTRSTGGLGLGLSIVRHIVEAHHGTIEASSAGRGKGSTFTMMLPMGSLGKSKSKSPAGVSKRFSIDGARLLVVEDDANTRATLTEVLVLAGAEVKAADGIGAAMASFADFHPDAIVCDIAMPGGDGCDLLRTIRARRPDEGGDVPALALTALASEEDRQRTRAAGFQMHVAKPVDVKRLIDAVGQILRRDRPKRTPSSNRPVA
jgi:PAS domain S-box-containing protein